MKRVMVVSDFTIEPLIHILNNFVKPRREYLFCSGAQGQIFQSLLHEKEAKNHDLVFLVNSINAFLEPLANLQISNTKAFLNEYKKNLSQYYSSLFAMVSEIETPILMNYPLFSDRFIYLEMFMQPYKLQDLEIIAKDICFEIAVLNKSENKVIDLSTNFKTKSIELFDSGRDQIFSSILSTQGFKLLAKNIGMSLEMSNEIKLIIVDADDSLWGGVIGEDGIKNLEYGSASFRGQFYAKFQKQLKILKENGVLLALCTKNNVADIEEVFRVRGDFALRIEDFALVKANWNPKSVNIQEILETVNLLEDSVLFLDDSEFEINEVKRIFGDLRTAKVAVHGQEQKSPLEDFNFRLQKNLLEEDSRRTEFIRVEAQRTSAKKQMSIESYLESLELRMKRLLLEPQDIRGVERACQLFTKTNQFNLFSERLNESEIKEQLLNSNSIYLYELSDNFGEYGIIGLIHFRRYEESKSIEILNFALSCRAMGRRVEYAILNSLIASYNDINAIKIRFRETAKNAPAMNFLMSLERENIAVARTAFSFEVKTNDDVKAMQSYLGQMSQVIEEN